ncbi:hypothetical protein [Vibrio sp. WXL103]|uniref:hypothetical protein n=1 Tax=unclassified Vibrio TaxID=2614977 RepID=UPI003EC69C43
MISTQPKLLAVAITSLFVASASIAAVVPTEVAPTTPGPDSRSVLTDISAKGYAKHKLDPASVATLPVPAFAGENMTWKEETHISDTFDYVFAPTSEQVDFGDGRWYNFYHNSWDGPGSTYWKHDHVKVENGNLEFMLSRSESSHKQGKPGINSGCISSNNTVHYPAYVEASVSMPDISMATAFWLLSPDDTQEIDILEAYPGADNGNSFFADKIHLSHHSFIRTPFTDYQPRDEESFWKSKIPGGAKSWGEHGWNNGDRQYMQIGVNWINPWHFEYFIDGELVRVLYNNAVATKEFGRWSYTYPQVGEDNKLVVKGWQAMDVYKQSKGEFDFDILKAASEASPASIIDPYDFQKGKGFNKEMDIIINMEFQDWWNFNPTDEELADKSGRRNMLVDWIRVFKPVKN